MAERPESWTIAELASRVGMTARNIRAHQSRGLVPPPERRGRVAYYDATHEAALLRVRELQEKGYNLAAISELVSRDSAPGRELQRVVLAPLLDGDEVELTHHEMAAMFGLTPSARRLSAALDSDLLREVGGGRYAAPSRQLLESFSALVEQGLAPVDVYGMQVEVARATRDVARRFVEACLRCAWEPGDAGDAAASPEQVRARFEALRDRFTAVLAATFAVNVKRATEQILTDIETIGAATPTA